MLDVTTIITAVIATLTAGGWLTSRRLRRRDDETHRAELAKLQAELTASIKDSETKYVREALAIYSENVVKPLQDQLHKYREEQVRFQEAVNSAPSCPMYPIVLLYTSCKAKKTTTTTTRVEVQQYTDSATLIHVRLAELVALETLRTWHQGDTAVLVRSFKVATRTADTTAQASSQQLATNSAEKTETIQQPPLMVERKKKGVAWLCPIACSVVLIFLALFIVFRRCVKK